MLFCVLVQYNFLKTVSIGILFAILFYILFYLNFLFYL